VCVRDVSVSLLSCVGSGLATADPPSMEFYQLSVRFIVFGLILNGKRPEAVK
jgi:hypothetical protein